MSAEDAYYKLAKVEHEHGVEEDDPLLQHEDDEEEEYVRSQFINKKKIYNIIM